MKEEKIIVANDVPGIMGLGAKKNGEIAIIINNIGGCWLTEVEAFALIQSLEKCLFKNLNK